MEPDEAPDTATSVRSAADDKRGGQPSWGERFAVFELDTRSLAVLRIGLGVLLIGDLIQRMGDLVAHYSDAGVLPISKMVFTTWTVSPHLWSDSAAYQAVLMAIGMLAAMALLLGYRTRLFTIVSWFLLISLHARNPLVNSSGDVILRLQLFWGIFLPLGQCWSLDARSGRRAPSASPRVLSVASAALILELCYVYWFSVAHKAHPIWFTGQAVYYAMSIDQMVTPLGTWLLGHPQLMVLLTFVTLAIEAVGPLLLFVPFRPDLFRSAAVALFVGFHVFGLGACLTLGSFPYIAAVAWLGLLPTGFWDYVLRRLRHPPSPSAAAAPPLGIPKIANAIAAFLLVYVTLWNLVPTVFTRWKKASHVSVSSIAVVLGIDQAWNMFSPYPWTGDGWYVTVGTLTDGRQVDIWTGGKPVTWDKPVRVAAQFKNERWRKYLENVLKDPVPGARDPLMAYLFRHWNETHGPSEQLTNLELYYMEEKTLPNFQTAPINKMMLGEHSTADDAPAPVPVPVVPNP